MLCGWLLGTIGAVLAIPLTLLAKALLVDVDPRARWANALLGSSGTTRRLRAVTAPHDPVPGDGSLPVDGTGPADPSAATALRGRCRSAGRAMSQMIAG